MDRLTKIRLPLLGTTISLSMLLLMTADACAILGAIFLTVRMRFENLDFATFYQRFFVPHHLSLIPVLAVYLGCLSAFRLYRYAWRFASLEMIWGIVCANTLGLFGLIVLQTVCDGSTFQRAVLFIIWLTSIFFVGSVRVVLRLINLSRHQGIPALSRLRKDIRPIRVVILGGGSDGVRLLSALREDMRIPYDVIGFLDETPHQNGLYLRGVRVLGTFSHLHKLLADRAVDEVLIRTPKDTGIDIREYVMACRRQQVPVRIIPTLSEQMTKQAHIQLENVSVEDLLRRPPVHIQSHEIDTYLTGKRVLVTGAGGSIGSEFCRQISALRPSALILLGHGENSLHLIQQELLHTHPELATRLHIAIGSVADSVRIAQIFQEFTPEVVCHAAAHKHVPLMEVNPAEAVQNNVIGTQCVAECCGRFQVERMVLISTDKAVYPSSVMGATKWLCEEVVRGQAALYPHTRYVTVRFGNVLGSRGSVVPIFHAQIAHGGPVTVTHPDMTRYFMTIPEAVQLVLQAGAIGESGDLYLLDMGKPVRIADLARDMIRLSGYEPDTDIAIVYTGLRPGEKMHERLASDDERLAPAACEGLSVVRRSNYFSPAEIHHVVQRLRQLAAHDDTTQLLVYLDETVPAFAHQRVLPDQLPIPLLLSDSV